MILHALHDVARGARVEERHGQLEQLVQEVRDERGADARADVQQDPALQDVDGDLAKGHHQLPNE